MQNVLINAWLNVNALSVLNAAINLTATTVLGSSYGILIKICRQTRNLIYIENLHLYE